VTRADAGFFSSIGEFFGMKAQAIEAIDNEVVHNSQNVPLMESSLNPELKLGPNYVNMTIIDEQALESNNIGPLGVSDIEQKYASTKKIETYTVKSGDTLEKISKKFGISKNTLINSNDSLSAKGSLTVGQVIAILPVEGVAYEVKKGDTIETLARKYSSSAKEILRYNDMENASDLQIGDTIVLPGGKKPIAKVPEKKTETPKQAEIQPKEETQEVPPPQTIAEKSESTPSAGGFIWPLPLDKGRISQRLHDDNAVDIAAPSGTPIYAIKDGTVLIADGTGWNGGYGKYVVVNFTDGGQALFGHMVRVGSVAGQSVKQGDVIGYVGTTGSSTGNHLHLSMRGGVKNPYGFLIKNNTGADFK
jgi:murein DD-endopeptidase MepM/ murein hydrolase activator NlpD